MPVFHGILSSLPLLTSVGRKRIRFTSLARSKMHVRTVDGILLRLNDKFGRRSIIRYTCRANLVEWWVFIYFFFFDDFDEVEDINILSERLRFNKMLRFALFGIEIRHEICNYCCWLSFIVAINWIGWIDVMVQLMSNQ